MHIEAVDMTAIENVAVIAAGMQPNSKRYKTSSGCQIWVSPPTQTTGWHLSISHPHRYPKWGEIKQARNELLPRDKTFAMLFPPDDEYVNIHSNTFHLWQVVGNYRDIDLIHREAFE